MTKPIIKAELTPAEEGIITAFVDAHGKKAIDHLKAVQTKAVSAGEKWTIDDAYEVLFDFLVESWIQDPGMPDPGESNGDGDSWDEGAEMFDATLNVIMDMFKAEGHQFETMEFTPAARRIRFEARLRAKMAAAAPDLEWSVVDYKTDDWTQNLDEASAKLLFQKLSSENKPCALFHGDDTVDGANFDGGDPDFKASKKVKAGDEDKPTVDLVGGDGNAFAILGKCSRAAKKAGWSAEKIKEFQAKATSGDYDNLLQTVMEYFNVEGSKKFQAAKLKGKLRSRLQPRAAKKAEKVVATPVKAALSMGAFEAMLKTRTGLKASDAGINAESFAKVQKVGANVWISNFIKAHGLIDLRSKALK